MDSIKVPLVINKLQSKAVYDYLASQGMIGVNELYLIQHDDNDAVVSVEYNNNRKVITYTDESDNITDVVSVAALKTAMQLSNVASDGSYDSLSDKPQINGVTLTGNKASATLGISYNDLSHQPTIPTITSNYASDDTVNGITGKGVATALSNYTPSSRSVIGTGALSGGGALTSDITITHKAAPTGLVPQALKVATDSYGHVQLGGGISANDVDAVPTTYQVVASATGVNGDYGTVIILGQQSETLSFSTQPIEGSTLKIYYVNVSSNTITLTIPGNLATNLYCNGTKLASSETITVASNEYKEIRLSKYIYNSQTYMFINQN